ncbi:MAG: DNA-processing protein DprA, partial [Candidatus Omnitrophica bacterium]|nr:DNA-processing protein DprA [Candidatus Omnitrophota bacterium]
MDERSAYIALNMIQGVGPISIKILSHKLGSAAAIFEASEEDLLAINNVSSSVINAIIRKRNEVDPFEEERRASKNGINIISYMDADYPLTLKQIHDPPLALYAMGRIKEEDKRSIAVVGTRYPTHYGRSVAEKLSIQMVS